MGEFQKMDILKRFLAKAGCPAGEEVAFIDEIERFAQMMAALLEANKEQSPNFLSLGFGQEEHMFEITISRVGGKSPADVVDELKETIEALERGFNDLNDGCVGLERHNAAWKGLAERLRKKLISERTQHALIVRNVGMDYDSRSGLVHEALENAAVCIEGSNHAVKRR